MRRAGRHLARGLLAAALVPPALVPGPAGAQVALPEGAEERANIVEARDRVSLPVDVLTLDGGGTRRLEGRVVRRSFVLAARDRLSPLAILEQAVDPLRRGGWELVFDCVDSGCGGAVARFALPLLPAPDMRLDTADMALATFRATGEGEGESRGDGARWVTVIASRVLGEIYVQILRVGEAGPDERIDTVPADAIGGAPRETASAAPGGTAAEAAGGEGGAGEGEGTTRDGTSAAADGDEAAAPAGPAVSRPAEAADAEALRARLRADGHVPLLGIEFDTGGARIAEGGAAVIEAAAAMLRAEAGLDVAVVGHTDYSGDIDINMALAAERAAAVADALVAAGIARERLVTHGAGPFAPLATNATAEGRALNRRVELVLIP